LGWESFGENDKLELLGNMKEILMP